jgi:hypothetical protein
MTLKGGLSTGLRIGIGFLSSRRPPYEVRAKLNGPDMKVQVNPGGVAMAARVACGTCRGAKKIGPIKLPIALGRENSQTAGRRMTHGSSGWRQLLPL